MRSVDDCVLSINRSWEIINQSHEHFADLWRDVGKLLALIGGWKGSPGRGWSIRRTPADDNPGWCGVALDGQWVAPDLHGGEVGCADPPRPASSSQVVPGHFARGVTGTGRGWGKEVFGCS
jgi:hypothetical protein